MLKYIKIMIAKIKNAKFMLTVKQKRDRISVISMQLQIKLGKINIMGGECL